MWIGDLTLRLRNWIAEVAQDGPFGNHATLTDGLVSYWALDELSGTRYDSVTDTGNDLTDNNTVTYAVEGSSGTSASFVTGNTESLTIDPGPAPTELSVSMWVNLSACAAGDQYGQVLALKDGLLFIATGKQDTGTAFFCVEEYSSAWYETFTTKGWVAHANNTGWNHILVEVSDTAHTITIYVNGALWVGPVAYSNPWGTGVTETLMAIGPKGFQHTGSLIGPATAGFNPKIDNVGIWGRTLTAGERTALYNSGVGKSYADLTADELVSLVSYWNLDEVSGARYDSHGSNDLTDNNTVGSVNSGPEGVVANTVRANSEYLSHAGITVAEDHTLVLWYKDTGTFGALYEIENISYDYNGGNHVYGTGAGSIAGLATIQDGNWHMYTIRQDGTTAKGSNDASTVFTRTVTPPSSASRALRIGYVTATDYSDQHLARCALWNRALTDEEVSGIFNSGSGKRYDELTDAEKVGLVSYWDLTETSGTRSDSHGTNHLTDNNTVGSVVNAGDAMDGAAATFLAADSEYLSRTSVAASPEWTVSLWAKDIDGNKGFFHIAGTWPNENGGLIGLLNTGASTNFNVLVMVGNGSTFDSITQNVPNGAGLWHYIVVWFDGDKSHLQIDNGTITDGASLGSVWTGSGTLYIGSQFPGVHQLCNGSLDEVAYWSRVLTADERADLFNAGKGLFYGD